MKISKNTFSNLSNLQIGMSGSGKAYHEWDEVNQSPCSRCKTKNLWLVGSDKASYESGPPYYVKCLKCGLIKDYDSTASLNNS